MGNVHPTFFHGKARLCIQVTLNMKHISPNGIIYMALNRLYVGKHRIYHPIRFRCYHHYKIDPKILGIVPNKLNSRFAFTAWGICDRSEEGTGIKTHVQHYSIVYKNKYNRPGKSCISNDDLGCVGLIRTYLCRINRRYAKTPTLDFDLLKSYISEFLSS